MSSKNYVNTKTLNDIPYEVYLHAILCHLDFKAVGNLSRTSKILKEIFDNNNVWQQLYYRTKPPVIVDSSIHIGQHSNKVYSDKLDNNEIIKVYPICKPNYWGTYGSILYPNMHWNSCGHSKLLKSYPTLKLANLKDHQMTHIENDDYQLKTRQIRNLPVETRDAFYNAVKEEHVKQNKQDKLSQVCLCREKKHYIQSTLKSNSGDPNSIKPFKKMLAEEFLKKSKRRVKVVENKLKTREIHLKEMKLKLEEMKLKCEKIEKDIRDCNLEETTLNRLINNCNNVVTESNKKKPVKKKPTLTTPVITHPLEITHQCDSTEHALQIGPYWMRYFSHEYERFYYHNQSRGTVSQWEKPPLSELWPSFHFS
jgi:hypothetical protein